MQCIRSLRTSKLPTLCGEPADLHGCCHSFSGPLHAEQNLPCPLALGKCFSGSLARGRVISYPLGRHGFLRCQPVRCRNTGAGRWHGQGIFGPPSRCQCPHSPLARGRALHGTLTRGRVNHGSLARGRVFHGSESEKLPFFIAEPASAGHKPTTQVLTAPPRLSSTVTHIHIDPSATVASSRGMANTALPPKTSTSSGNPHTQSALSATSLDSWIIHPMRRSH